MFQDFCCNDAHSTSSSGHQSVLVTNWSGCMRVTEVDDRQQRTFDTHDAETDLTERCASLYESLYAIVVRANCICAVDIKAAMTRQQFKSPMNPTWPAALRAPSAPGCAIQRCTETGFNFDMIKAVARIFVRQLTFPPLPFPFPPLPFMQAASSAYDRLHPALRP